ncbi:PRC-barrel domain-containing protein [Phormidium sp. FACHB-592]|uniref:PRC-barrel domain-containing protein n=1 Tax=Stenomitos frigidus AS-A4 TaxID=2933935 RepID=A0ABV0KHM1_9CYAN|nr:PRC-barrel domain-containing protein [Phormidium sp. FACHB-592]MBD2073650.1 PRC-barrel domain-containing protein [Phormidium sp. FACHB-592]
MTTPPDLIRQSDLLNQLVLDRSTMETLGRVEVMWMYPSAHRVLGFVCKAGSFGTKKTAFRLAQISTLGSNGILTHNQPEETDATKVRQLESLLQCEVWSDTGNKSGKIIDYLFSLRTGEINCYLLASSGWAGIAGDLYQLPPAQILSLGRRRVLVTESVAQNLAVYQTGIKQTLAKAKAVLQEDYGQATEELRSLSQQAQTVTEQAKGRLQSLTGQFKERARSLSQQAQATIQTFNEQLQEDAQTIVGQTRENSQQLTERMKERTQTFSAQFGDSIQILTEQVEDGIQTLTVQAKEILEPTLADELDTLSAPEDAAKQSSVPDSHQASPETFSTAPSAIPSEATDLDDDAPWIDDEPWIADESIAPPTPIKPPQPTTELPASTQPDSKVDDLDDDEPWI